MTHYAELERIGMDQRLVNQKNLCEILDSPHVMQDFCISRGPPISIATTKPAALFQARFPEISTKVQGAQSLPFSSCVLSYALEVPATTTHLCDEFMDLIVASFTLEMLGVCWHLLHVTHLP